MKRLISLILLIFLCFPLAVFSYAQTFDDDRLSDEDIAEILNEITNEGGEETAYIVIPEDFTPPVRKAETFSLLLIGVDTDASGIVGRSDTMILATLNPKEGSLKLVSFMRDMYVSIPKHGHNRLNAAHVYGGPDLLVETLEKNFGINIDGYLAVNFTVMVDLVDAVGGIDIEVAEEELKPLNGILEYYNYLNGRPESEGRLEEYGLCRLTGLQAMSYARIRKIDSDYARTGRQQRVVVAIFNVMRKMSLPNLLQVIENYLSVVKTDLRLNEMLYLAKEIVSLPNVTTKYLRVPVKGSSYSTIKNKAYVLLPNLKKNREVISEFLYGAPVLP